MASLSGEGIEFMTGRKVLRVLIRNGKKVVVTSASSGNEEIEADEILVASGRAPNVASLGLDRAGVKFSERGIAVNGSMMTSNPDIFAAGDVVDQKYKLETLAAREGAMVASNIFNHTDKSIPMDQIKGCDIWGTSGCHKNLVSLYLFVA